MGKALFGFVVGVALTSLAFVLFGSAPEPARSPSVVAEKARQDVVLTSQADDSRSDESTSLPAAERQVDEPVPTAAARQVYEAVPTYGVDEDRNVARRESSAAMRAVYEGSDLLDCIEEPFEACTSEAHNEDGVKLARSQ